MIVCELVKQRRATQKRGRKRARGRESGLNLMPREEIGVENKVPVVIN